MTVSNTVAGVSPDLLTAAAHGWQHFAQLLPRWHGRAAKHVSCCPGTSVYASAGLPNRSCLWQCHKHQRAGLRLGTWQPAAPCLLIPGTQITRAILALQPGQSAVHCCQQVRGPA